MSIAGRAFLALLLMVGFYLLALLIAGGLLYLPYAEMVHANRLHMRLALFCIVGAGVILWSIVPRPDRFAPPGPRLEPLEQRDLFRCIEPVARATGQAMPAEVFLVPDVNAWVSQRGGIMGFGSRPVMGLGLPLLQTLTVPELEAVLAHEFGHHHGGDTRLGPWVYKTRAAIGRTLQNLARHSTMLSKPFQWYGNLFLRITMAVSRAQELAADRLAARCFGPGPLATGLQAVAGAGMAFGAYWQNEAVPVLQAGFRPPLADGFGRFLQAERVAGAVADGVQQQLTAGKSNPYDTHPPLPQRLAALGDLPAGAERRDGPPAITLLANLPQLEAEMLRWFGDDKTIRSLKPLGWNAVGEAVYLPSWEKVATRNESALRGQTLDSLPELLSRLASRPASLAGGDDPTLDDPREASRQATLVLGAALSAALASRGWEIHARPGEPIGLRRDSRVLHPFDEVARLAGGEEAAEAWRHRCQELGISAMPLLSTGSGDGGNRS